METGLSIKTAAGEIPVSVQSDGRFMCDYEGAQYYDNLFSSLSDRVRTMAKKQVSMAVPGTKIYVGGKEAGRWNPGAESTIDFVPVTITGVHSGNGNVMYRHDDSPRRGVEQTSHYEKNILMKRMTTGEQNTMLTLYRDKLAAEKAYDTYVRSMALPTDQDKLMAYWNKINPKKVEPVAAAAKPAAKAIKTRKK